MGWPIAWEFPLAQLRDTTNSGGAPPERKVTRRDFLYLATGALGVAGVAAVAWPLIDQMEPSADVLALGAPITVDISSLKPGAQVVVQWRSHPIFIVRRTSKALDELKQPSVLSRLSDPDLQQRQQPKYAQNWSRSIKPEYLVLVGICTHLGCVPGYKPAVGEIGPAWPGGYFCPCHGSKYDLAGRVFKGVPAPLNLPVPPYRYASATSLVIGEDPKGSTFTLSDVETI